MQIYPDYYEKFKCIADRCKHNCCIGWEIDIDPDTFTYYNSTGGEFGDRLKCNIECGETPCFKLTDNERCPFLNKHNLCDIITTLGEDKLCTICSEHPRFHNELPDRVESGLGLACEEACRIILSHKDKVTLLGSGDIVTDDEIIMLRDKVTELLQNRDKKLSDNINDMLTLLDAAPIELSITELCHILQGLERMDNNWDKLLCTLIDNSELTDTSAFDKYMQGREHEYEQLCVYLIYRHFANSPDIYEAQRRARFVTLSYKLIYCAGAIIYAVTGSFDFMTQVELVRLFSSEIEYSDENLYTLFDML